MQSLGVGSFTCKASDLIEQMGGTAAVQRIAAAQGAVIPSRGTIVDPGEVLRRRD